MLISAWLCVVLGLMPLEIQSRALTLQTLTQRHRLDSHQTSQHPAALHSSLSTAPSEADRQLIWRALLLKDPPQHPDPSLQLSTDGQEVLTHQRGARGRRHVNSVGGRAHLMRVGCVLGTCQVQNLSHRLYQLIGQSGREDSSPINPRSPHSYG